MIAAREEISFKRANQVLDKRLLVAKRRDKTQVMLSGDISFSYPFDPAVFDPNPHLVKFQDTIEALKQVPDWALIFTRENNFGKNKGIQIVGNRVKIQTIDGDFLQYDLGQHSQFIGCDW